MRSPGTLGIVYPRAGGVRTGNRTTALRWAAMWRRLGWRAFVAHQWDGRPADALIALHAAKSAESIRRFAEARPGAPLIVAASGTDVYSDAPMAPAALESFGRATRIVMLQEMAVAELPAELRDRARVVYQSVNVTARSAPPVGPDFVVCVVANLRAVKDPLCAAEASALLPSESRVSVRLIGAAIDDVIAADARVQNDRNPRFSWLGEVPRPQVLAEITGAHVLASTSHHEGGANVVMEALALDVPVLATDIPGSRGLLGDDHPGLFRAGDRAGLAELLRRAETEPAYLAGLTEHCRQRAWITDPETELEAWRVLIDELFESGVTR